jgi:predicted GIY-YIG superfamily endonuclease
VKIYDGKPDPGRTALYRYFDAADVLLYVGISNDPDERWKSHRYGSGRNGWPKEAVRRTIEWRDSRPEALRAEEEAIKTERPLYNEKHNYDDAPFSSDSWPKTTGRKIPAVADLMRAEISSGRWGVGQRIPSLRTLGEAADASMRIVSKASVVLQGEGLLDFQPGRGLFVARPQAQRAKLPHDWFHQFGFPG